MRTKEMIERVSHGEDVSVVLENTLCEVIKGMWYLKIKNNNKLSQVEHNKAVVRLKSYIQQFDKNASYETNAGEGYVYTTGKHDTKIMKDLEKRGLSVWSKGGIYTVTTSYPLDWIPKNLAMR